MPCGWATKNLVQKKKQGYSIDREIMVAHVSQFEMPLFFLLPRLGGEINESFVVGYVVNCVGNQFSVLVLYRNSNRVSRESWPAVYPQLVHIFSTLILLILAFSK